MARENPAWGTIATQKVYRYQLKPVISTGATAMNAIFSQKSA